VAEEKKGQIADGGKKKTGQARGKIAASFFFVFGGFWHIYLPGTIGKGAFRRVIGCSDQKDSLCKEGAKGAFSRRVTSWGGSNQRHDAGGGIPRNHDGPKK